MPIEARRRILRLTLGVTGVFGFGLFLGWPLAVIGTVFTALFLQAPAPLPAKVSLKLFTFAIALMLGSLMLFSALEPYQALYLAVVALAIILSFSATIKGAGVLPGVLALMAAMMIPNLLLTSDHLTFILATWVPANLLIAGFASALCFVLIPAQPIEASGTAPQDQPDFDPTRRLLRMSMVTVPFALVFFLWGWSALLVLFFVALLSQQLAAMPSAGGRVARAMLSANLLGAAISIVFYEINVIAPTIVTPVLLCALLCLCMGSLGESDHALAPVAGSALTTVLIVYGGSIAPFSDEADAKSITRVVQVATAAFFVIIAYLAVDEFLPERKRGERAPAQ